MTLHRLNKLLVLDIAWLHGQEHGTAYQARESQDIMS
jgi:hypothetical protein